MTGAVRVDEAELKSGALAAVQSADGGVEADFIGEGGARLMSSWQTTDADIDALVADIRSAVGSR